MKIGLLLVLCCVCFLSDNVFGEEESEIKKGTHPFMAFIYYSDVTITESNDLRFLRGAVLVKPEWLISSMGSVLINDTPIAFPRKTLLARLGAVTIDANFTYNEDEDEQEREVVQIVRPYNRSDTQWWRNDVSLLKTLLPFNLTSVVNVATIRMTPGPVNSNNCFMLMYAANKMLDNSTEERVLTHRYVEIQSTPNNVCGSYFDQETMLCATDSEDLKTDNYDPNFCQGNSGAPLICENEVTGLQTYIENNCKPPYLYQLLSTWDNFITCGIEDKCNEEHCSNMCIVVNKDDPITEEQKSSIEEQIINLAPEGEPLSTSTEEITVHTRTTTEDEDTGEEALFLTPPINKSNITVIETIVTTERVIEEPHQTTTVTVTTITTTTTTEVSTEVTTEAPQYELASSTWPKQRHPVRIEDDAKVERKTNVEAQYQERHAKSTASDINLPVTITFTRILIQFVLASLIV